VILVAVALAWWAMSDLALRWVIDRAVEASSGRLTIEQPERVGFGGMRATRVSYADAELRVEANDVLLLVSARSLLQAKPLVRKLTIGELRIRTMSQKPRRPRLPDSLALPFEGRIASIEIARIVVERAQNEFAVGAVALALAYDAGRYRLELARLDTPWGEIGGALSLRHAPPFELEGAMRVASRVEGVPEFALALDGRLDALGVGAFGTAHGADVRAQALITPFAPEVIAAIRSNANPVDPRRLHPAAPSARLRIESQATIDVAGAWAGRWRIDNATPGSPVQGRMPIERITGAFHGSASTWALDDLVIDGRRAGRLNGTAGWQDGEAWANLSARAVDLSAIHPSLHSTALSGPVRLRTEGMRLEFSAHLAQSGLQTAIEGALDSDKLVVRSARFQGHPGRLVAAGMIATRAPHRFQVDGRIDGFDPARLGRFPSARVNASVQGDGALTPPAMSLAWKIADSSLRGQPLAGAGKLRLVPDRATGVDLMLSVGAANATARGDFGAVGDRLVWTVDVPDLGQILADAAGRMRASGVLRDRWRVPALELQADASGLRLGNRLRLERIEGRATLAQGSEGRFEVHAQTQKLALGSLALDRGRFELTGTRVRHSARVSAVAGKLQLEAGLDGGVQDDLRWTGTVESLNLQGSMVASLAQAVPVSASLQSFSAGPAVLRWGQGQVDLAELRLQTEGRFSSRGRMRGIALASLAPFVAVPEALLRLVVGGEWNVDAGTSLDGTAGMWWESGDILISGAPALVADVRTLRVDVRARDSEITLEAQGESGALGVVQASGSTRAERRTAGWGISGDAPLTLRVRGRMPTLAWARPFVGDAVRMDAAADLDMSVSGTWARPEFAGNLAASRLRITIPEHGFALEQGELRARFDAQRMEIVALRFASGEGTLEGRGQIDLARGNVSARLDLAAQKLTVVSRPDRLLVLSGKGGLEWGRSVLRARGEFVADRGAIELPREEVPRPSGDVVVLKRPGATESEVGIHADLRLDLGSNFVVRGRGLDARLVGVLRAQLAPKTRPTVTGTVRAAGGTYAAFGQTLAIERAALNFVGPPDNPALDIVAMRKNLTVEVGVAVGGTALLPRVRLVSNPAMSDADKLAWLTLGHGLNQAGGNEAAVLQAAAMALIARGDNASGFTGSFASRFGLDELSLGTQSATGERVVSLGKRFATNVYVGFERGVTGAVSVVKITYDLSRRWSVQARAGTENAVDLFYTLGFR